jgi:peptidase A4-like protein
VAAAILALAATPAALADTSDSANWAGYAVHRSGLRFRQVFATWREPSERCSPGSARFSAAWVGIGGFSETSNGLEQIGTEVDCSNSGETVSSAWYELVPAPAQTIAFRVRPGDVVAANVTVDGGEVVMTLANDTLHRKFIKTLDASMLDLSSAEWIVEAPSSCSGVDAREMLPLADFGSVTFHRAAAESSTRHLGSISDRDWGRTLIRLRPGGQRFVADQGAAGSAGAASPSALSANGTAFRVTYWSLSVQANPFYSARAVRAGYILHRGR